MHYETPYVNYTYPIYDTKGDHPGEIVSTGTVLDEGDVVFKDELSVKPLTTDIPLPSYAHPTDAGLDLHAISVETPGTVIVATCIIQPGMTAKVHTGIAIKLPHGTFGAVYPRSGLATKTGLAPANMVGVIDENYTGEIIVALHNYSNEPQAFAIGDRIAQLVIQPVVHCTVTQVTELPHTDRGNGSFGSTGEQ